MPYFQILSHPVYTKSNRVSIYLSMDSEVQTNNIVKNIFDSEKICFIPKCVNTFLKCLNCIFKLIIWFLGTTNLKCLW